MRLDKRGDIGFMEALAGAMTVCIVLTAFTAFLAADAVCEEPAEPEFDWSTVGGLSAYSNMFSLGLKADMGQYIEDNGFAGVEIRATSLVDNLSPIVFRKGTVSDECVKDQRTVSIKGEDGRCTPGLVEVTLYL